MTVKHLLSAADLSREQATAILEHRELGALFAGPQ